MNKIEVAVLHEAHDCPAGMMMFLAKLTQRGHNIKNMEDLMKLYNESMGKHKTAVNVASLPHGTIKRFTPITIAVVGASRRFLAQGRTHQVGFNYVSASLQYSDYSGEADFVVPYGMMRAAADGIRIDGMSPVEFYLRGCQKDMEHYQLLTSCAGNDAAGYAAPQGLRNVFIMQANHEAWMNFIRARGCSRNTEETQYVTLRIWEELLKTEDGDEMFYFAGPDCMYGMCREGKMCCGKPLRKFVGEAQAIFGASIPRLIIEDKWPLLKEVNNGN